MKSFAPRWLSQYRSSGLASLLETRQSPRQPQVISTWAVDSLDDRETLDVQVEYATVHRLVRYRLSARLKAVRIPTKSAPYSRQVQHLPCRIYQVKSKQCFKGVGMRWSKDRFNHLLPLRLAWTNQRFDALFSNESLSLCLYSPNK